MIKIIKEGVKEFNITCPFCGCEFTYEKEDIHNSQVICPCCSTNLPVRTVNTNTFQMPIWYNQPVVPDGYKIRGGLNKQSTNWPATSDNWSSDATFRGAVLRLAEKLKQCSYCDNCFKDGKWHRYVFVEDIDDTAQKFLESET